MLRPASTSALAALAAACLPAAALATDIPTGTGGASPDPPAAAPTTPAPAASSPAAAPGATVRPVIDAITCRSSCKGIAAAVSGSVVQVSGEAMDQATSVVFLGRRGSRDDVTVAARPAGPNATLTVLPAKARSGAVRVVTAAGVRSQASRRTLRVGRAGAAMRGGPVLETRADTRKVFADGAHAASVSFFVRSGAALDASIDVIRAADGASVAHWDLAGLPAGSVHSVAWDGKIAGVLAPEGRYVWRVTPANQAAARASSAGGATAGTAAAVPRGPSFLFLAHQFPVAGPHQYGGTAARFGAGRAGHTHEGQDVFAACGTPLVAVIGGTIKFAGVQGNAGNYLVLTGADGTDYAYMHLKDKVTLKKGDKVSIGQAVGRVGDTGDAVGCHLHFEAWPAPGWYTGGSPIDPLPLLREWDGLPATPPAGTAAKH